MKRILSIQSHVAYGYVGNRAAVFPLQRMGYDVTAVNTVQFSNHTGYGHWAGDIFDAAHIRNLLDGLDALGILAQLDAILSGYLGDAALGELVADTVASLRRHNPGLVWCCDPVMGDEGRGFFVRDNIPDFFRQSAVPLSSILTPNQFELTALTGIDIKTLADAHAACEQLHARGPSIILVTSLIVDETPAGAIQMLASETGQAPLILTTPRLKLDPAPNGAGDCTAALFAGNLLSGLPVQEALERTGNAIFSLFEMTARHRRRELAIIESQDYFVAPPSRFSAEAVNT